ncbi:hypothetical protein CF149_03174 [Pseudomonas psychrophila]|jgi:hypothetical protein|nr:hypothetical protein CF149_03174 [Pseudomonas psychrophila]
MIGLLFRLPVDVNGYPIDDGMILCQEHIDKKLKKCVNLI